jgi:phage shock protein A
MNMYVKQMIEERLEGLKENEKWLLENVERYENNLKRSQSDLEGVRKEKGYLETRLAMEEESMKLMTSNSEGATGGIFKGESIIP